MAVSRPAIQVQASVPRRRAPGRKPWWKQAGFFALAFAAGAIVLAAITIAPLSGGPDEPPPAPAARTASSPPPRPPPPPAGPVALAVVRLHASPGNARVVLLRSGDETDLGTSPTEIIVRDGEEVRIRVTAEGFQERVLALNYPDAVAAARLDVNLAER
ncbi:MAG: hypothetical protein FJ087_05130 [Deltaproteobacteria bacterium]|nr:hypothetical protein [Deltaproteobacteria bacterium]